MYNKFPKNKCYFQQQITITTNIKYSSRTKYDNVETTLKSMVDQKCLLPTSGRKSKKKVPEISTRGHSKTWRATTEKAKKAPTNYEALW